MEGTRKLTSQKWCLWFVSCVVIGYTVATVWTNGALDSNVYLAAIGVVGLDALGMKGANALEHRAKKAG